MTRPGLAITFYYLSSTFPSAVFKYLTHRPQREIIYLESAMDEQTRENPTNWPAFGLIITFIFIGVVLVGYLFINSKSSEKSPVTPPTTKAVAVKQAQITITKEGFVPAEINVKKGTEITWTNTDEVAHQVASDPHPNHDKLKDLGDGEVLAKGESFSFIFERSGSYTYHDHLNPLRFNGKVVVE